MPVELGSFSLGAIAGGIVIGIANHYLSKSRNEEERFNKAADTFSIKVRTALIGIYPVTLPWLDSILFTKIQQSVLDIEAAAAEFMPVIKRKSEPTASELEATVKEYHDYCQQKKYEKAWYSSMFPNSPRPRNESGIDSVEEFINIVEHLFFFANKKITHTTIHSSRPLPAG